MNFYFHLNSKEKLSQKQNSNKDSAVVHVLKDLQSLVMDLHQVQWHPLGHMSQVEMKRFGQRQTAILDAF